MSWSSEVVVWRKSVDVEAPALIVLGVNTVPASLDCFSKSFLIYGHHFTGACVLEPRQIGGVGGIPSGSEWRKRGSAT